MSKQIQLRPGNWRQAILFPNNPVTALVIKVIHQRSTLIRMHVGKQEFQQYRQVVDSHAWLINQMEMKPYRTELEWCRWFNSVEVQNAFSDIFPGKTNNCYKKWMQEWESAREYSATQIAIFLNNKPIN